MDVPHFMVSFNIHIFCLNTCFKFFPIDISVSLSFFKLHLLHCGPVIKNPPCSAGDVGSMPGQGTKTPLAVGQLNLLAATTEPMRHI